MIRNMDLIRTIVLAIRAHEGRPSASEVQAIIREEDNGVFGYHIVLLTQGAMMTGVDTSARKDRYGIATLALTWAGQDFADSGDERLEIAWQARQIERQEDREERLPAVEARFLLCLKARDGGIHFRSPELIFLADVL